MADKLTHVDADGRPAMVDISDKRATRRTAVAESRVLLPEEVARVLRDTGGRSKKGPVFDTAIVAGIMAAKRTHELIPFCHPMAIDDCRIHIDLQGNEVVILCQVSVEHRTGVEMEAMTGATLAALTVYDMCKGLSHEISIEATRLLIKRGGKSDFNALIGNDEDD